MYRLMYGYSGRLEGWILSDMSKKLATLDVFDRRIGLLALSYADLCAVGKSHARLRALTSQYVHQ